MTWPRWPLYVGAFVIFATWMFLGPYPNWSEMQVAKGAFVAIAGLFLLMLWANRK